MDSILTSIKKLLGIGADYTQFDADVIMHINSVFFTLKQLGVGPVNGFRIQDNSEVWEDFLSEEESIEAVKSYMYLRVRLLFDPNSLSAAVIQSMKEQIAEYEWRFVEEPLIAASTTE